MALLTRSGKPKLVGDKTFATEARAQLGLLIAEREARAEKKAQRVAVVAAADARAAECRQAVSNAAAGVEAAKRDAVAALMEGTPSRNDAVRAARNILTDAQDALEVIEIVNEKMLAKYAEDEQGLGWSPELEAESARVRMQEAAIRVFAEGLIFTTFLAELHAAEMAYLSAAAKLRWLDMRGAGKMLTPPESANWNHAVERAAAAANWRFFDDNRTARRLNGDVWPQDWDGRPRAFGHHLMRPAVDGLDAAMAAMQLDANAPLPELK